MSATDQPPTVPATFARISTTTAGPTNAAPADQPGSAKPNLQLTDAVALAHRVAVLAETDPAGPLIVAVRAALEIADARHADRRDRRMVGLEVHGGDSAWWARWAAQWMPYAELAALRAVPGTTAPDGKPGEQAGARVDIDGGAW